MPILDTYYFEDLIKPRRLRLRRNLNSTQIAAFKYAFENNFIGSGLAISTEFPIYEFSRIEKWVSISLPYSSPQRFIKLAESEVKAFFSLSI